jgi:hypothetical protein
MFTFHHKSAYPYLPGVYAVRCRVLMLALLLPMLSACVPVTTVTRPDLTLHIQDERGNPISQSTLTLYWWEYPHHRLRGSAILQPDLQGTVRITETSHTEVIMPLVPHGVPAYNWTFCIQAENFLTLIGTINNVEPGDAIELHIPLHQGASAAVCDQYDRLHFHHGQPRTDIEDADAHLNGVYEVQPQL